MRFQKGAKKVLIKKYRPPCLGEVAPDQEEKLEDAVRSSVVRAGFSKQVTKLTNKMASKTRVHQ
jgi:hypothetical protein